MHRLSLAAFLDPRALLALCVLAGSGVVSCKTQSAPLSCAEGQIQCAGGCADPQTDGEHCGGCGQACAAEQTCAGGVCQGCPEGQQPCGGTCTDLQTDGANCGQCGNACGEGQSCVAAACQGGDTCPQGRTLCQDSCVDTATDPANCGGCGNGCPAGEICQDSSCQAAPDCRQTPCPGLSYCDLGSGQCKPGCIESAQCAAEEECDRASHACVCKSGYRRCGSCVPDSAVATCGSSCTPCSPPAHATATCDGTRCGLACEAGYRECEARCAACPAGAADTLCRGAACVAAGTCSDGILNQGETDVDCGGPCPPCAAGQICAEAGDCAAAVCNSNPRCSGGICAQRPEPDKTSCDEGGPQTRECYSGSCLTLTSWCSWKSETSSYYYVWDESLGKYELSKFPSRCECNCWGLTYWIGGWPTSDECKRCTRNSNNTENYCWN